jgi:hypothetical protein
MFSLSKELLLAQKKLYDRYVSLVQSALVKKNAHGLPVLLSYSSNNAQLKIQQQPSQNVQKQPQQQPIQQVQQHQIPQPPANMFVLPQQQQQQNGVSLQQQLQQEIQRRQQAAQQQPVVLPQNQQQSVPLQQNQQWFDMPTMYAAVKNNVAISSAVVVVACGVVYGMYKKYVAQNIADQLDDQNDDEACYDEIFASDVE